jgi:hypothetical protein
MVDPLLAGAGALVFLVFFGMGLLMALKRWRQRPNRIGGSTINSFPTTTAPPTMQHAAATSPNPAAVQLYSAHPIYEHTPTINLLVRN